MKASKPRTARGTRACGFPRHARTPRRTQRKHVVDGWIQMPTCLSPLVGALFIFTALYKYKRAGLSRSDCKICAQALRTLT